MSKLAPELQQLIDLIEAGSQPVIELISDPDGVFPIEPGMKARCLNTSIEWEDIEEIVYEIHVNCSEFEQYNRALERPIWYDRNGFSVLHSELEPDVYTKKHSIYVGTGSERNWKLVENASLSIRLLDTYKNSEFKGSYVNWLEWRVLHLEEDLEVSDCIWETLGTCVI